MNTAPGNRLQWLQEVLLSVRRGHVGNAVLDDILADFRFLTEAPPEVGRQMNGLLCTNLDLFSPKQQQVLFSLSSPRREFAVLRAVADTTSATAMIDDSSRSAVTGSGCTGSMLSGSFAGQVGELAGDGAKKAHARAVILAMIKAVDAAEAKKLATKVVTTAISGSANVSNPNVPPPQSYRPALVESLGPSAAAVASAAVATAAAAAASSAVAPKVLAATVQKEVSKVPQTFFKKEEPSGPCSNQSCSAPRHSQQLLQACGNHAQVTCSQSVVASTPSRPRQRNKPIALWFTDDDPPRRAAVQDSRRSSSQPSRGTAEADRVSHSVPRAPRRLAEAAHSSVPGRIRNRSQSTASPLDVAKSPARSCHERSTSSKLSAKRKKKAKKRRQKSKKRKRSSSSSVSKSRCSSRIKAGTRTAKALQNQHLPAAATAGARSVGKVSSTPAQDTAANASNRPHSAVGFDIRHPDPAAARLSQELSLSLERKRLSSTGPMGTNSGGADERMLRAAQIKAAQRLAVVPCGAAPMREGDWLCSMCNAHNYRTKQRCFRCFVGLRPIM